jgi:hypothetical protein
VITFTVYEIDGEQRFAAHRLVDGTIQDVTGEYECHGMTCSEGGSLLVGWHIGRREPKPPCIHIETSMFEDGWATCAGCGVEVNEAREPRGK